MEKQLTATFDHPTERNTQIDIELLNTSANYAIFDGANPSLTAAQYVAYLDSNHIEYAIYERPRRRPRN